jgi:hypothetical protein
MREPKAGGEAAGKHDCGLCILAPRLFEGRLTTAKKTFRERETELRILLATPVGREELDELVSRYHSASGKLKPAHRSPITYIRVHERLQGLISG